MSADIAGLYAAALGLMTVGLATGVVVLRARTGIATGHGNDARLERAIRAHGNLIEYAPIFLILLVLLDMGATPAPWLHGLGGGFLGGRILSAAYFWLAPVFLLRVAAFWGAVLPIVVAAALVVLGA